jgi:hypothetical protein
MLVAGGSGVQIPVGARDVFSLRNVQTGIVAHLVSISVDTGVLLRT